MGKFHYVLFQYDTLDKKRPEGAIGEPVELKDGIKRWEIDRSLPPGIPFSSLIHKMYVYTTDNGTTLGDVVLTDTSKGCLWETSSGNRYESLREAEEEILF